MSLASRASAFLNQQYRIVLDRMRQTQWADQIAKPWAAAMAVCGVSYPADVKSPPQRRGEGNSRWGFDTLEPRLLMDVTITPEEYAIVATAWLQMTGTDNHGAVESYAELMPNNNHENKYDVMNKILNSPAANTHLVKTLYRRHLNRDADSIGLSNWVDQLNNGATQETVMGNLIGSQEYRDKANLYSAGATSDAKWIDALYHDLLGRAPNTSPTNDVTTWLAKLEVHRAINSSTVYVETAKEMMTSQEFRYREINQYFNAFLGHNPDDTQKAWYHTTAGYLRNMKLLLMNTPEYYSHYPTATMTIDGGILQNGKYDEGNLGCSVEITPGLGFTLYNAQVSWGDGSPNSTFTTTTAHPLHSFAAEPMGYDVKVSFNASVQVKLEPGLTNHWTGDNSKNWGNLYNLNTFSYKFGLLKESITVQSNATASIWPTLSLGVANAPVSGATNPTGVEVDWEPGLNLNQNNIMSGDYNGDGKIDIAGIDSSNTVWVGISDGIGGFDTSAWSAIGEVAGYQIIEAGDFNGDSREDLSYWDIYGKCWVLLSNGETFTEIQWSPAGVYEGFKAKRVADVNGDHRADWITLSPNEDTWFVGVSNGTGMIKQNWGPQGTSLSTIRYGDFNSDGRTDIVGCDSYGKWVVGISTGTEFITSYWGNSSSNYSGTTNWLDVQVGDFNGDDRADLIGRTSTDSANWSIFTSTGTAFTMTSSSTAGLILDQVKIGDLNGDGRSDLIGKAYADSKWQWHALLTNSDFSFTNNDWLDCTPSNSNSLQVADFAGISNSTLQAFQNIYNTIAYEPYNGLRKGADATEATKSGNDWDQASLLIKKLQALKVPVQYKLGQVKPSSLNELEQYLGVGDRDAVVSMLRTLKILFDGHYLVESLYVNDPNESPKLFHALVRAYLPGPSGFGWYDLDPSWKYTEYNTGRSIFNEVPFSPFLENGSINQDGYLTGNIDSENLTGTKLPLEWYEDKVQKYLADNNTKQSIADIGHNGPIITKQFKSLAEVISPNALPYTFEDSRLYLPNDLSSTEFQILKAYETIRLTGGGNTLLDCTFSLPDVVGAKTLAISYAPTGQSDVVIPEIRLDGAVVFTSTQAIAVGVPVTLTITRRNPSFLYSITPSGAVTSYTYNNNIIKAGQEIGIGLQANQWSSSGLLAIQAKINQLASVATPDKRIIQSLEVGLAAMQYFYEVSQQQNAAIRLSNQIPLLPTVGDGIVIADKLTNDSSKEWKPDQQYPVLSRLVTDNPNIHYNIQPLTGFGNVIDSGLNYLIGMTGSVLESHILEHFTNGGSVSTVQVLRYATKNNNTVIHITANNANALTLLNGISDPIIKERIVYDVTHGYEVWVPQNLVDLGSSDSRFGRWIGTGWIRKNNDGTAYMIAGPDSIHGGANWGNISSINDLMSNVMMTQNPTVGHDPVNYYTGALIHDETDVSIPNPGLPLEFSRHYDSSITADLVDGEATSDALTVPDMGLGNGWTHSYSDFLIAPLDGSTVVWTDNKGIKRHFTRMTDGTYQNAPGVYGKLIRESSDGSYSYTNTDGTKRNFDLGKDINGNPTATIKYGTSSITGNWYRLNYIIDRNDNQLQLDYTANNQFLQLVYDTKNQGRYLLFTWSNNPYNHLAQVTDFTGRVWNYKVSLITGISGAELTEVDSPLDSTLQGGLMSTSYTYLQDHYRFGLLSSMIDVATNAVYSFDYYLNRRIFSVSDPLNNLERYSYDFMHQRVYYTDERGNRTVYEFNEKGHLLRTLFPDRTRISNTWNETNDELSATIDQLGYSEKFTYNANTGYVASHISKNQITTAYTYDDSKTYHPMTSEVVAKGTSLARTTSYSYDSAGNKTLITNAINGHATMTYDARGTLTSKKDYNGNITSYIEINEAGQAQKEVLPISVNGVAVTQSYTYNTKGNLLTSKDGNNNVTSYAYDILGERLSTQAPSSIGAITTSNYRDGDLISVVDPNGNTTSYAYDKMHRLTMTTAPDGTFTRTVLDPLGNVSEMVDYAGNTTQYVYDTENRRIQTLNADGSFVRVTYDGAGRIVKTAIPKGMKSTSVYDLDATSQSKNEYDAVGHVLMRVDADPDTGAISSNSPTTTYSYDALGNQTRVDSANHVPTVTMFDALNRAIKVDPALNLATVSIDHTTNIGTVIFSGYSHNLKVGAKFDISVAIPALMGSYTVSSIDSVDPKKFNFLYTPSLGADIVDCGAWISCGTSFTYDANGNVIAKIDPNGKTTSYAYDGLNRKIREIDPVPAAGQSAPTTQYSYDGNNNLVRVVDPRGSTTQYTYDALNRKILEQAPDAAGGITSSSPSTSFAYDGNGNLTSVKDARGYTTSYTYDRLNRKIKQQSPDPNGLGAPITQYVFDANGNLVAQIDALQHTTYYRYDSVNRKISTVVQQAGEINFQPTTNQQYDLAGNLVKIIDANGNTTSYAYDALNRKTSKIDPAPTIGAAGTAIPTTTYYYDAVGNQTRVNDPNGSPTITTYDTLNRVIKVDPALSLATISVDHTTNRGIVTFNTYSHNFQTNAKFDISLAVQHVLEGNYTVLGVDSVDPKKFTFTYDRILSTDIPDTSAWISCGTIYGYDANGNVVKKIDPKGNTTSYVYDALNRKIYTIDPVPASGTAPTTTYMYDAVGNQTRVDNPNGSPTVTTYDTLNRVTKVDPALNLAKVSINHTTHTGTVTFVGYGHNLKDGAKFDISVAIPTLMGSYTVSNIDLVDPKKFTFSYSPNLSSDIPETDAWISCGTSYSYDLNGNIATKVDPNGNTTSYAYDALNRKITETGPAPVAGQSAPTTQYKYDVNNNLIQMVDPRNNTTQYIYDALNRKIYEIDPVPASGTAPTTTYMYDAVGNQTRVDNPNGSPTVTTYDALNRVTKVDPALNLAKVFINHTTHTGTVTFVGYNHNLQNGSKFDISVAIPSLMGSYTVYSIDSVDPKKFTFTYSPTLSADIPETDAWISCGTSYNYDPNGNLITTVDPKGNTTSYAYDALNRKITEAGPAPVAGQPAPSTQYKYDVNNNLIQVVDPRNSTTQYAYDALNRKTLEQDPNATGGITSASPTTSFSYDRIGNLITVIDAKTFTTSYTYDALNRKIKQQSPNPNNGQGASTTQYGYDPNNNLVRVIDPRNYSTQYIYDALNRKITKIDPNPGSGAPTTQYGYDKNGNLLTVTDPNSNTTSYTYDALNRKLTEIDPVPASGQQAPTTQYSYDAVNNLIRVIDPRNSTTQYTYDALNRKIMEQAPDTAGGISGTSPSTSYAYDVTGNLINVKDANSYTTSYSYDALNRKIMQQDPAPTTGGITGSSPSTCYAYDLNGNLISVRDANGFTTGYTYDTLNRKIKEQGPNPTNGGATGGPATNYAYDLNGNLTSVIDPSTHTTQYAYDALNRKTLETNPLNITRRTAYDLSGNIYQIVDRNGRVINYNNDALNRVADEIWYDSSGARNGFHFNFDLGSRLTTITDWFANNTTYNYDHLDRVTSIDSIQQNYSTHVVLSETYDKNSNRLTLNATVGSAADLANSYQHDTRNRITQIQQQAGGTISVAPKRVNYSYNPLGQYNQEIRYSSLDTSNKVATSSYTYDKDNRLTSLGYALGSSTTLTKTYAYAYDTGSRITGFTTIDGTTTETYDAGNQLLTSSLTTESYTYDPSGNRTTNNNYQTDNDNRVTSDATYTYTYDHEGNRLTRNKKDNSEQATYTWDHHNRLTKEVITTSGSSVTINYTYDTSSRRISQTVSGSKILTERYIYDGEALLMVFGSKTVDYNTTTYTQRYFNGASTDQILAEETVTGANTVVRWALADHEQTVRDVVDNTGATVGHIRYDSFGNILNSADTGQTIRMGYTGQVTDTLTGLDYYKARYYDPQLGRFISQDPMGFDAGDTNLYRYVKNNPVNLVDPTGLRDTLFGNSINNQTSNRWNSAAAYTGNSYLWQTETIPMKQNSPVVDYLMGQTSISDFVTTLANIEYVKQQFGNDIDPNRINPYGPPVVLTKAQQERDQYSMYQLWQSRAKAYQDIQGSNEQISILQSVLNNDPQNTFAQNELQKFQQLTIQLNANNVTAEDVNRFEDYKKTYTPPTEYENPMVYIDTNMTNNGFKNLGEASAVFSQEKDPHNLNTYNMGKYSNKNNTTYVTSAETMNEAMVASGKRAAWKPRTEVVTKIVPAGTRYQMVVTEGQANALMRGKSAFGNFATTRNVTSQEFARNKLVILPEFKADVSRVVTVETTAPQFVNIGKTGKIGIYEGNVEQVEFVGPKNLRVVGEPRGLPSRD